MFWICEIFDSLTAKEGARHILSNRETFLLFRKRKDAKKYVDEVLSLPDEYIEQCVHFEKIQLKELKKLFGNYEHEII